MCDICRQVRWDDRQLPSLTLVRRITASNSNMASKWTRPSGAEKAKKKNTDEEKCSQDKFKAFVHDAGWRVAIMPIIKQVSLLLLSC